jgi:saccharopepsin
MFYDDLCLIHGFLGLTPSSAGSHLGIPSPFMNMAAQNLLDSNIFSLRLNEPRELTFGGVDSSLYAGAITRIPLSNHTSRYTLTGRWQAEAEYFTIGADPGIRLSLAGRVASFGTSTAFMLMPDELVVPILEALEFELLPFLPPSVSCDKRAILPDLTFNLAGKNFTLTPYDWTLEWVMEGGRRRCVSALVPMGLPPGETNEIFLGSAFVRAFYSVWDLDTRTIGCEFLPAAVDSSHISGGDKMNADY